MTRSLRQQQREAGREPDAPSKQDKPGAAARRKRVPLGVPRSKLTVPQREGYRRRWINDDGGRLQQAQQGGYGFVTDPDLRVGDDDGQTKADSRVSRIVGRKRDGTPMRAFLMEIENDLFQEDQAVKAKAIRDVDDQIKRGGIRNDRGDTGYVPKGGIKIRSGAGKMGGAEPEPEVDNDQ